MDNDLDKFSVGDKILLIKGRNSGTVGYEGQVLIITAVYVGYYSVKSDKNTTFNIFYDYEGYKKDDFCLASRKEKAKYLKNLVNVLKKQVEENEREIEFLEKYETEEDYLAEKLMQLMEAKNRLGIVKLLKEMRKTDHL